MTPNPSSPGRGVAGALALLGTLASAPACSSSAACTPSDGTITVTVRNNDVDSNTNFLCNATVTLTAADGGATSPFTGQGADGSVSSCIYVANVGPGSYRIATTVPGFSPATQPITVPAIDCVTNSPSVTVELFPDYFSTDAGLGGAGPGDAARGDAG